MFPSGVLYSHLAPIPTALAVQTQSVSLGPLSPQRYISKKALIMAWPSVSTEASSKYIYILAVPGHASLWLSGRILNERKEKTHVYDVFNVAVLVGIQYSLLYHCLWICTGCSVYRLPFSVCVSRSLTHAVPQSDLHVLVEMLPFCEYDDLSWIFCEA
jgi:hypothetical protein